MTRGWNGCALLALAALGVACGGSVTQSEGTGGNAASGGGAGISGGMGGGTAGFAGSGGIGGSAVGGAGGSFACGQSHDALSVTIEADNAFTGPVCDPSTPTTWEQTGQVVKTDKNTFVLDTCPPNADCMAMFTTVSIAATDLELWIPQSAYVSLKYELLPAWGSCTKRITLRNVSTWGGSPNPAGAGDAIFFVGTDGVIEHPDAPFVVDRVPLGCSAEPGCGGYQPDDYALSFSLKAGEAGTLVAMGQTVTLVNQEPWQVRNLRSYQTPWCDDYWNWAWYAAWVPTSAADQ